MKTLRTYCELIRLPNTFTAVADILAGYWLASMTMRWSWQLGALLVASAALYSAGMIFNDLHDIETDRRERPGRPLPSGRIKTRNAKTLAVILSLVGVTAAALAGNRGESWAGAVSPHNTTAIVALILLVFIVAYDFGLKSTPLGPVAMGACRGLNIFMPMTAVSSGFPDPQSIAAIALFVFITSVTYFGRHEVTRSTRGRLVIGTTGIIASLLIAAVLVAWNRSGDSYTLIVWLATSFLFVRVAFRAVRNPQPRMVQYAMKTFILGIIALDATFATAAAGWIAGAIVLALLIPSLVLGKRLYST